MNKLIINPTGGLANRMRFIAAALTLAKDLGIEYRIVWLSNWEIGATFEQVFEMPTELSELIEYPSTITYGLLYSIPRKKNFYLSALSRRRFALTLNDLSSPLADILRKDCSDNNIRQMIGKIKSERDILIQGGTNIYSYSENFYRKLFKLKAELQQSVDKVIGELGQNIVGVHIRRTDNIMSINNSPDSFFERAMLKELENEPSTKFYLATDSENVKARFKMKFGNKIAVSSSVARRDTIEGIKNAAIELFILARTSKIFGSFYSSFSEAAAMLGNTPLVILKN